MCPSVCSKQTPPLHGVDYKAKRLLQISARGQNEGLNLHDMTRLTQNADEAIRGIKIEMMSYFSPRGPPQNLGFSREQLGRFKHPADASSILRPEKANESLIVFYCARQDRRIGVVWRGYYAYDDYIESSPRPNQLARGLSLRGLACLPKTLIQHRIQL